MGKKSGLIKWSGLAITVALVTAAFSPGLISSVGNPVRLTVRPDGIAFTANTPVNLSVIGTDAQGAERDVTAFSSFSVTDPYGTITGTSYLAGKAGVWEVTAIMGGLVGTAHITVAPGPLADLAINPNSAPEILSPGQTRTFSVLAYDAKNNRLPTPDIAWTVEGEIGTVSATGKFLATRHGLGKLQALGPNNISDVINIKVREEAVDSQTNGNQGVNTGTANTNSAGSVNASTAAPAPEVKGQEDTEVKTSTSATTTAGCNNKITTLGWWLILAAFAIVTGAYYSFRRTSTNSLWWFVPAVLTAVALWVFAKYHCAGTYLWWPYTILGIAVVMGALFLWLRPRKEQLGINL